MKDSLFVNFVPTLCITSFFKKKKKSGLRKEKISRRVKLFRFIKALLYFKGLNLKYDAIAFTASNSRRLIDGKYISGTVDCLTRDMKALTIERLVDFDLKSRDVYSKSLLSEVYIDIFAYFYKLFLLNSRKGEYSKLIGNVDLEFHKELGFNNIDKIAKTHYSKYLIVKFILRSLKVKVVFIDCAYERFWLVQACKCLNIHVVEVQHGQFTEIHEGYFPLIDYKHPQSSVDEILVYSEYFSNLLSTSRSFNSVNKIPVGSFFVDYYQSKIIDDARCEHSFCVSLASIYDEELINRILPFFETNKSYKCYLFPRGRERVFFDNLTLPLNVFVMWDENIYERLIKCRYHITVNSTCAYEASALGCYNIIVDPCISDFFTLRVEIINKKLNLSNEKYLFVSKACDFVHEMYSFLKLESSEKSHYWFLNDYINNVDEYMSKNIYPKIDL
ncbi:hypothetical protein [Vibrio sp. TRT 29B02]|uniref:hypothetical protein n=1 Tax=Vibrio sp. TRT 29B02 TaxID=3418508 RepID=UPI003CEA3798